MDNLYRELEQKYKELQLESDRIQTETNQKIAELEKRKSELEQSINTDNKELEELKQKISEERNKTINELDSLSKILLQHLKDLSKWKGPNEFSVQQASANRIENELHTISTDDQVIFLGDQFKRENKEIEDLWKQKQELSS